MELTKGKTTKIRFEDGTAEQLILAAGLNESFAWSTNYPGLGVRIYRGKPDPDGCETFTRYWVHGFGRHRRPSIGKVGEMTLQVAARKVSVAQDHIEENKDKDPYREKKRAKARAVLLGSDVGCPKFQAYVEKYLSEKREQIRKQPDQLGMKQKSYRTIECYLADGDYFKSFRSLRLDEIDRQLVSAHVREIVKKRSAHTATAARRCLSSLFRAAIRDGYIENNPCIGGYVPHVEEQVDDRRFEDSELSIVWRGWKERDELNKINKLIALTCCRKQEVGGIRRSEIKLRNDQWELEIPAWRHKMGRKTKKPHFVPLLPEALEIINSMPRHEGRDCIFGQRSEDGFTNFPKQKKGAPPMLGLAKSWGFHAWRHTAATVMGEMMTDDGQPAIQPWISEALLNHAPPANVHNKHYNHATLMDLKRAALRRWTDYLMAAVDENEIELPLAA
jgi:integrase